MFIKKTAYSWSAVLGIVFLVLVGVTLWGQVVAVRGASLLLDGGTTATTYPAGYQGGSINIIIGAAMLVLIIVGVWAGARQQPESEL
ncbi:MAG: hypothetical protein Fur0018_08490 [Anaerolineales bacterium]